MPQCTNFVVLLNIVQKAFDPPCPPSFWTFGRFFCPFYACTIGIYEFCSFLTWVWRPPFKRCSKELQNWYIGASLTSFSTTMRCSSETITTLGGATPPWRRQGSQAIQVPGLQGCNKRSCLGLHRTHLIVKMAEMMCSQNQPWWESCQAAEEPTRRRRPSNAANPTIAWWYRLVLKLNWRREFDRPSPPHSTVSDEHYIVCSEPFFIVKSFLW